MNKKDIWFIIVFIMHTRFVYHLFFLSTSFSSLAFFVMVASEWTCVHDWIRTYVRMNVYVCACVHLCMMNWVGQYLCVWFVNSTCLYTPALLQRGCNTSQMLARMLPKLYLKNMRTWPLLVAGYLSVNDMNESGFPILIWKKLSWNHIHLTVITI